MNNIPVVRFQTLKLALCLVISFVLFTIIGTVSHELGHFIAALLLGYNPSMNYAYTFCDGVINPLHSFIITLCGPLQTILTGTTGLVLILVYRRNFYAATRLNFKQWLIVFISLFWLREVFNFLHGLTTLFLSGDFPAGSDEVRLALELSLPALTITLSAAIIGCCVLCFVIFRIIPVKQRLLFITCSFIGGLLGFYLWFQVVGPVVLP